MFDLYFYKCVLGHIKLILAFKQTSVVNDFAHKYMPSHKLDALIQDYRVAKHFYYQSNFFVVYMHLYMKYFDISLPK